MTELSDREIGERMLAALDERGWHQGGWWDRTQPSDTAPVCIGGALRCALWGQPYYVAGVDDHGFSKAWIKLSDQLFQEQCFLTLTTWNDGASTSEEDIRLLIKRTFFE